MGLETILITVVVAVAVAVFAAIVVGFIAVSVSSLGNYPPYQNKLDEVDPNWPFPTDKKP